MISFLFKKKPIHVDCFTDSLNVAEIYPIKKAFNYVPEWWRDLDRSYFKNTPTNGRPCESATMKSCAGFIELYKKGFVIPLWTDLDIFCEQDFYQWNSGDGQIKLKSHNSEEHNNTFSAYHHIKMKTPWMIRETTGVKFLWTACTWSQLTQAANVRIVPAVIEYKYQHSANIQCFVPRFSGVIRLSSGMPLIQVIPLSERPIKITTHVLDVVEYQKLGTRSHPHKFVGGYSYKKKCMKDS